jgi:hypothetical protein
MRKFILTVMASLLSCSAAYAFWPEAADSSLEIGVGYRQDRIEWKTRDRCDYSDSCGYGNGSGYDSYGYDNGDFGGGFPFGRSHVKWKNLNIWEIEARGKYVTCDNIYLRANADYGWITSGKNHDSDHRFNFGENVYGYDDSYGNGYDSEFEFARSSSRTRGHVYDARLAVGYEFKLCDCSFGIAPLIGYSWHGQHLRDRHLRQNFCFDENVNYCSDDYSFSDYESIYGGFNDSYGRNNSRYHTRWNGPFIGFDFDYRVWCDWTLFGTYEFHWARYHARGHWFLRGDLPDGFRHRGKNAYGNIFDIGLKMDFCDCWTVSIKGEFQWWYANHGRDRARVFEARVCEAKTHCVVSVPLRHIKWDSAAVIVDVGSVF